MILTILAKIANIVKIRSKYGRQATKPVFKCAHVSERSKGACPLEKSQGRWATHRHCRRAQEVRGTIRRPPFQAVLGGRARGSEWGEERRRGQILHSRDEGQK